MNIQNLNNRSKSCTVRCDDISRDHVGPLSLTVDGRRVPPPFLAPLPQASSAKPQKKKKRKKKEHSSSTELSAEGSPGKGYAAPMHPPSPFQPQIQGLGYPLSAYSRHSMPPAKLSRYSDSRCVHTTDF